MKRNIHLTVQLIEIKSYNDSTEKARVFINPKLYLNILFCMFIKRITFLKLYVIHNL